MSLTPPSLPELLFVKLSDSSYLLCEKLSTVSPEDLDPSVQEHVEGLFRDAGGPFEICDIPSDFLYVEDGMLFMQARLPVPNPPRP